MKGNLEKKVKIQKISLFVILRIFICSFLIFEFIEMIKILDFQFLYKCIRGTSKLLILFYFFLFVFSVLYFKCFDKAKLVILSCRLDLLFTAIIGAIISHKVDIFFYLNKMSFFSDRMIVSYRDLLIIIINWIKEFQLANFSLILFIPPVAVFFAVIRYYIIKLIDERTVNHSRIVDDNEILSEEYDKLKISSEACNYAEKIWNNGAKDSIVFGLDAPWGSGKSSFLNIVIQYFNKTYAQKVIVYKFNPTQYQNKDNIINVFAKNLVIEIRKKVYIPELFSIVLAYSKVLSNSLSSFSQFGVNFSLYQKKENLENLFQKLENLMNSINKKVIIIIDDLDRLDFNTIKEIILVIQKGFSLPNMTFVLCYDTGNISVLDEKNHEAENISQFLEKYINIKTSIYIDFKTLSHYFVEMYKNLLSSDLLTNTTIISRIINGIEQIYNSSEFYKYRPFLSNVRKIKRLINTVFMLDLNSVDFVNWDINIQDLVDLLLIYVNYPNIFRIIYDSETAGKKGFFSIQSVEGYNSQATKYENNEKYISYIANLTEHEKFLVNKIFGAERINKSCDDPSSLACVNGSEYTTENRNLEKYINLIINQRKPLKIEEYNFYKNVRDEIIACKKSISEIIWHKEFNEDNGSRTHENLYKILYNTPSNEFNVINSKEIIRFIIDNIHFHPLINDDRSFGSRSSMILNLINFLDKFGWYDKADKFFDNSNENVIKIAHVIFETTDSNASIINSFIEKNSSILIALYDLLIFRLFCCSSRGGRNHNLSRALICYSNPGLKTDGVVTELVIQEVRLLSQKIFEIFQNEIIEKQINIFDLFQDIQTDVFLGEFSVYLRKKFSEGEIVSKILKAKNDILSFVLYQLSNDINSSGIGCGYYNSKGIESDVHKGQIKILMNTYLFEYCFNREKSHNAYDYLFTYLTKFISNDGFQTDYKIIHKETYLMKILYEVKIEILKKYWIKNKDEILRYADKLDQNIKDVNINELIGIVSAIVSESKDSDSSN